MNRIAKKIGVLMLAFCMLLAFAGCSGGGTVGYWQIQSIVAGDITMGQEDAESIGLSMVGAFKLNKSGSAEITILGEETEGTWEEADDGTITVTNENDEVFTGTIDDENVMTLTDPEGVEYTLQK